MTQPDYESIDRAMDAARASFLCDLRAIERGVPIAELECPHGYIGDGPCACYQLYRVDER